MFANLHRRDQDPQDLQVQRNLAVGETIKSKRMVTCVSVVEGQLLVEGAATAHIGDECVDLTSDVVALHGIVVGAGDTPAPTRFAAFGQAPFAVATVPTIKVPYAAEIIAVGVQYLHSDTEFSAAAGANSISFSIGQIPSGSANSAANFAANLLASNVVVFDNDEDDTFPGATVTGLSIAVAAGAQIGVSATIAGTVGDDGADYSVVLYLRGVNA